MFRLVLVVTIAVAASAFAGPKKVSKPKPKVPVAEQPCATFTDCMKALNDAFERGDFELAQRHAARSETFAQAPQEQAQLFAVKGALDAQSLGLDEKTKESVRRNFAQAQRLDAALTFLAIPAYARTEALEALWTEARPVVEPKVEVRTQLVEVPVVVQPPPPPPPVKKFPVVTTLLLAGGLAAAGVGIGFGVSASGNYQQAQRAPADAQLFLRETDANRQGLVATISFISAGVFGLAALIVFLAVD
ncbi:MAG: hypothetical protein JNM17_14120 [Archangium sp.]|nr:hypothetical protein [Archangium sp.]